MVVLNLAHIKGRRLKFGTPLIFLNIYIKMGNSFARQEAVCIPQHDKEPQIRESKLQEAKQKYQLEQKTFEIPDMRQRMVDICLLPPMVSVSYLIHLVSKRILSTIQLLKLQNE